MPSQDTIRCQDLVCGYHGRTVLDHVSLSAVKGESIALLGANGSGKSTLIKSLCGVLKPDHGSVEIDGISVASGSPSEIALRVAVVPQDEPTPFPFLVREVVTMGRLPYGSGIFDTADDVAAADEAMRVAECVELADRPLNELSGGEKQRVLLARAIAQDTPVVLMDEPTAHLDPAHQVAVAALVKGLTAKGKTVLSAVHDLNLASLIAVRAVVLGNGQVAKDGPVEDVLFSDELEQCYGTRFERIRTSTGRLLIAPLG
ncbi:MAG TPA: ABC transporter ATP-binding protein [Fimbriimonas sp.]|nr:ABC transporter ATP-binding protein [Fimbriimonas sp.]